MYSPRTSWQPPRERSDPYRTQVTKDRIKKQLAAVIELTEHNAEYLEPFEIAWIEHIIAEAVEVTFEEADRWLNTIEPERSSDSKVKLLPQIAALRMKLSSAELSQSATQDDLKLLLATSGSLNSASNLLSCCYDRWRWLNASDTTRKDVDSSRNELREFLDWRKQFNSSSRNASTQDLRGSRIATSSRAAYCSTSPTLSATDERLLSLSVDGTVEKWRQNAEEALNETNARVKDAMLEGKRTSTTMGSCRPSMTDEEPLPFLSVENPPPLQSTQPSQTCMRHRSRLTRPASTCSNSPIHVGISTRCCMSSTQSAPSAPEETDAQTIRRPFKRSLQNSFDKEPVSISQTQYLLPGNSTLSQSPPRHGPSHGHSRFHSVPQPSPMISQTTIVIDDSRTDVSPASSVSVGPILSQRINQSTISMETNMSESGRIRRSRGRVWLEQQAEPPTRRELKKI